VVSDIFRVEDFFSRHRASSRERVLTGSRKHSTRWDSVFSGQAASCPQLRAVALRVRLIASSVITDGAVVRSEDGADDSSILIAQDMRLVEGFRLAIVLTELTVVPDDDPLPVGGLNNCRWIHSCRVHGNRCMRGRVVLMNLLTHRLGQIDGFQLAGMCWRSRLIIVALLGRR
jgi:hypothetical protein